MVTGMLPNMVNRHRACNSHGAYSGLHEDDLVRTIACPLRCKNVLRRLAVAHAVHRMCEGSVSAKRLNCIGRCRSCTLIPGCGLGVCWSCIAAGAQLPF